MLDGRLITQYSVICGMCHQSWIDLNKARCRTDAGKSLRENQWAMTRAWGWICPRCDKHGSTGVVPAPGRNARELFEAGQKIIREREKS